MSITSEADDIHSRICQDAARIEAIRRRADDELLNCYANRLAKFSAALIYAGLGEEHLTPLLTEFLSHMLND